MDICVVTGDLIFFSAVEGVAGAMGHIARQATSPESVGQPDLTILDVASLPAILDTVAPVVDLMRTAAFIPHVNVAAFASARALGFAHVHRRGSLATELPRIIAEYAGLE